MLVEAFKARRETLRFPAAPDAAGTHRTSLCLNKKLEKNKVLIT